jgi:hypothetical protein
MVWPGNDQGVLGLTKRSRRSTSGTNVRQRRHHTEEEQLLTYPIYLELVMGWYHRVLCVADGVGLGLRGSPLLDGTVSFLSRFGRLDRGIEAIETSSKSPVWVTVAIRHGSRACRAVRSMP